jgi:hypothetical protein
MSIIEGLGLSGLVMLAAISSITIAFARQPKLAYVLPFKAYRLTVLDTGGGTPIYNHTWQPSKEQVDETLFSGMLQGVSVILKESLNQGNVREISMDEGIMILQRSLAKNIACVLVASKSSCSRSDSTRDLQTSLSILSTRQPSSLHQPSWRSASRSCWNNKKIWKMMALLVLA